MIRAEAPVAGKVAIVSGGGSGHEPMHVGFVGKGMLDAACPGQVFTSPTPDQIEAATRAVDSGAGVLHIVKNYTGDIMNFEMAAELCQGNGVKVQAAIINDHVAVENSLYTAGRRGVGTTVLAEKICGAAAGPLPARRSTSRSREPQQLFQPGFFETSFTTTGLKTTSGPQKHPSSNFRWPTDAIFRMRTPYDHAVPL